MKRNILVALLIILGLAVFSYPYVSDYFTRMNASSVVSDYDNAISDETKEELEEQLQKAIDYNEGLPGKTLHDPFSISNNNAFRDKNYYDTLNVNGIMGYLEVPKINVKLPIYHGMSASVLGKGIGHTEGTALPIGGEGNHPVLAGHTGLPSAKLLTDLRKVEVGDIFFIKVLNLNLAYAVDQIKVVEPSDTNDLQPVAGKDYVTLVTCTPYGVNSHRLLVRGERIDYESARVNTSETASTGLGYELTIILTICGIIAVFLTVVCWSRKKRKMKHQNNS